jgi:hypothetical protein
LLAMAVMSLTGFSLIVAGGLSLSVLSDSRVRLVRRRAVHGSCSDRVVRPGDLPKGRRRDP